VGPRRVRSQLEHVAGGEDAAAARRRLAQQLDGALHRRRVAVVRVVEDLGAVGAAVQHAAHGRGLHRREAAGDRLRLETAGEADGRCGEGVVHVLPAGKGEAHLRARLAAAQDEARAAHAVTGDVLGGHLAAAAGQAEGQRRAGERPPEAGDPRVVGIPHRDGVAAHASEQLALGRSDRVDAGEVLEVHAQDVQDDADVRVGDLDETCDLSL
jgi:hypothetical protein